MQFVIPVVQIALILFIEFIRSEMKNTQGVYPTSLRILLDEWEKENG